ncbi:unnamed protein product [Amoebophrya sp. A25]|nr:unnamed protein product [Amoebophrya sp. A25]|eukprot:GSA25T00011108001.1
MQKEQLESWRRIITARGYYTNPTDHHNTLDVHYHTTASRLMDLHHYSLPRARPHDALRSSRILLQPSMMFFIFCLLVLLCSAGSICVFFFPSIVSMRSTSIGCRQYGHRSPLAPCCM